MTQWIDPVADAGGKSYTFHLEALKAAPGSAESLNEALALVEHIHARGMRAAVAISPDTPASAIVDELGNAVEMLLVMTVVPGKGGQKFIEACVPKVVELRQRFPTKDLQVDGGVGPGTVGSCTSAGSNVIVAGTALFGAKDPASVMNDMKAAVDNSKASWKKS